MALSRWGYFLRI